MSVRVTTPRVDLLTAVDTETTLRSQAEPVPRLVVSSWALGNETGLIHQSDPIAEPTTRAVFEGESVWANGAFDFVVYMRKWPHLTRLIFEAVRDARTHDVLTRAKLMDIASGKYKARRRVGKKKGRGQGYGLAACSWRALKIPIEKEGEEGPGSWRLRYGLLMDKPVEEWPEDARIYAENDVMATMELYRYQEQQRAAFARMNDGVDVLGDEYRQVRAKLALHLASVQGICVDPEQVARFEGEINTRWEAAAESLHRAGLVRIEGNKIVKTTKAAKARMERIFAGLGIEPKLTKGKEISLDREACKDSGDDLLIQYADFTHLQKLLGTYVKVLKSVPAGGRIHTTFEELVDTGRTSSWGPNLQNLPRATGARECYVPAPGHVFVISDFGMAELVSLAEVLLEKFGRSSLADAIIAGRDPHVQFAASMSGTTYEEMHRRYKNGDIEAKELRQKAKCFHPDTEVLSREGWKRIGDLAKGKEVMTCMPGSGFAVSMTWAVPLEVYTKKHPSKQLTHLKNEGIDVRVTPDHGMLAFTALGEPVKVLPHELVVKRYWANAGQYQGGAWSPSNTLLRLAVATQADGSYRGKTTITFGFKKKRKIERMRWLLGEEEAEFVEAITSQGATEFRLKGAVAEQVRGLLDGDKTLPWRWLDLSPASANIVLDEVVHWDGTKNARWTMGVYCSSIDKNIDVLQALASLHGRKTRACVEEGKRRGRSWRCAKLSIKDHHRTRGENLEMTTSVYEDEVACLVVPSGCVLVRDGGIPLVCFQTANFGFPGGLGPARFVGYAKSSNVTLGATPEEALKKAEDLRDDWRRAWPEVADYLRWIGRLVPTPVGPDGERQRDANGKLIRGTTDVRMFRSGRVRGRVTFTECANGYFQALAADAAKHALWCVTWRQFCEPGSALFGTRCSNFVHDEVIVEAPKNRAQAVARELEEVMVSAYGEWCQRVPVTAEARIEDRWRK